MANKERIVDENDRAVHPAQKPIAVIDRLLQVGGESVLDPYMGSGTIGVACIRHCRRFIGIELEPSAPGRPDYFGIAVKRCKAELERFPLFEPPKPKQLTLLESQP